jgi:hypothetical protein
MAYTKNPRPINRCQYWVEKEPIPCIYWDQEKTSCIFKKEIKTVLDGKETIFMQRGDLFPFCNYIGTAKFSCTKYALVLPAEEGEEQEPPPEKDTSPRCVLPDPYRHVSRTPNCGKWISPPVVILDEEGNLTDDVKPIDYSPINGYNDGLCNYEENDEKTGGTDITCSAIQSHHMGMGTAPFQDFCTISGVTASGTTTASGFPSGSHKPMNYDILNFRALMGRCKWWDSESSDYLFSLKQDNDGKLTIEPPEFSCKNTSPEVQPFSYFFEDKTNLYVRPPCNGAMPDCPKYTGNLASTGFMPYLSSVYLRAGDKVLAEQVLEIRYNLRKDTWDIEDYKDYFGVEAILFANEGTPPKAVYDGAILKDYSLKAIQTEIDDFICFSIKRTQVLLTQGTRSDALLPSFPTLIKELKDILLEPIIRSIFDLQYYYGDDNGTSKKNIEYIFETPFSDHEDLLIIGEFFGNNSNLFAINIDDPSFDFPFNNLKKFKNMYSYKNYFGEQIKDPTTAETEFSKVHKNLACYFKLLKESFPDKMYLNEWSTSCAAFLINVKTFFGVNRIFVFDTSTEIFTFSSIRVRKIFCGGIIAQTSFSATSNSKEISDLFDYELQTCFPIFSPKISYEFKVFKSKDNKVGALPYHTYLDTRVIVPPMGTLMANENTSYFLGSKLFKIKVMDRFIITDICTGDNVSRLVFLGNEGHVLVFIQDNQKLHSIIRNWDAGETDEQGNSKEFKLFLKGKNAEEKDISIEMVILEKGSDRLEENQFIMVPKNKNTYVRLYNPQLEFEKGLFIYERWSFGRTPSGVFEEINDGYPSKDVTVIFSLAEMESETKDGKYVISSLPTTPIIASVIFKGPFSGRIKGQTKTDLLIWVKKPFCSDVEIMYIWQANYQETLLLPTGYCFVAHIGIQKLDTHVGGYAPRCGDHNFGNYTKRPNAMWYPYTSCDPYATYALASGNNENDTAPMEFWLTKTGKPDFTITTHGSNDLRMLGPSKHYGYTVDTHAVIWACACDYIYHNVDIISEPWFAGWARIRGGVEGEAYYYLTQNGGSPPRFGNKHRPYLLSYRSNAAIHYEEVNYYGSVSVKKKWMPAYEAFSDLGLRNSFTEFPWKHYFNEVDRYTTYYSQLGLLRASSTVNGIDVSEELVREVKGNLESPLKRYSFDEVFIAHYTTTGMAYPEPRKGYFIGVENPRKITSWLTYRDYKSGDDTSSAIQWAWREIWKPLERELLDVRSILQDIPMDTCDTSEVHMNYLSFLNINYLNYTYDFRIDEFRRIPKEGIVKISWEPSVVDRDKPKNEQAPIHFLLRIGNGPARLLNTKLELITDTEDLDPNVEFDSLTSSELSDHIKFYKICSQSPWVNTLLCATDLETLGIDIFPISGFIVYDSETVVVGTEEQAKNNAKDDKRVVEYYEDGELKSWYFNRGLYFNIKYDMLKYIPKELNLMKIDYEFKLSRRSNDETDYSVIDTDLFYPANETFGIRYLFQAESVTIIFKFLNPITIGEIDIVFLKGREQIVEEGDEGSEVEDPEDAFFNYYHIPEVIFKKSLDDVFFTEIQRFPFESSEIDMDRDFSKKKYTLDSIDQDYMSKPYTCFSITFNFPYEKVIFEDNPGKFFHYIFIETVKFYEILYTKKDEYIQIYERKYNISVGSYGTYPIHGFESEGSLLYPNPFELSTIYQYDTSLGMAGMSDSAGEFTSVGKTRDRIAKPIQVDLEPLEGSYLDFEAKQKELYDAVSLAGTEKITLISVTEEIFKETLNNIGITTYPSWQCDLENSTMLPLMPVKEKELYYPEGHNWTWDTKSFKDVFNCGGGGLRRYATTFAYKWGRISGIYGFAYERDIFDLYSYGLSDVLTKMANPYDTIMDRLNSQ